METGKELAKALEVQKVQYGALRQAMERQTTHIEALDVAGLTTDTAEIRGLMRKVRDVEASLRPLRQSWSTMGLDRDPEEKREVDAMIESVRGTIGDIQGIKDQNAKMLQERMSDIRAQMAELQTQGKAAQAYYGPNEGARASARFIDQAK